MQLPCLKRAMKRRGLHVIIPAVVVGSSVNPSADRSDNDRVRSDNHSTRSNNNSTGGDNDRACGDAARPVHTGSANHGTRFRCRQGDKASH
jgi:hypothetical protein